VKLLFATTNPGKLKELRELVADLPLEIVSRADLEVDEDQPTFEGNAAKKARAYVEVGGLPALADDSGLCVDALDGRPGVLSARYAADENARIDKLLGELAGVPDEKRGAQFRCALALALPSGQTLIEFGDCPGKIIRERRGEHGFGYDPVFLVTERGKTMAELTVSEKSSVSHRGRAFAKMRPHLLALAKGGLG
jgi:XTP/dITP diphosphohydrolase